MASVIWLPEKNMHREHNLLGIDWLAQNSALLSVNPAVKVIIGGMSLLLCTASASLWLIGVISFSMIFTAVVLGKTPWRSYFRLLLIPSLFILLGGAAILIEITGGEAGLAVSITGNSLHRAVLVTARAYGAMICLLMISLTTPMQEIIGVLRRCRIPSVIIELMYLIYRFLTILSEVLHRMNMAARSRLGYESRRASLRTAGGIAANLLVLAFQKASVSFDAMELRGYEGRLEFWEEEKPVGKKEVIGAIIYVFFLISLAAMERMGSI